MNNKERTAMQQALEALENYGIEGTKSVGGIKCTEAITVLREALAEQPEQEPVAWVDPTEEQIMAQTGYVDMNHDDLIDFYLVVKLCKQLNSAPVRTKDLTDDEIEDLYFEGFSLGRLREFARAVIAADREKNK